MEPDRRESHTYIERDRERRSGGGTAMSFIVGGLVVAVALIALVFWGGDFVGGGVDDDADIEISTQDQVPDAVPVAPVENNVEINEAPVEVVPQATIESAPAEPAEQAPVAPAQN